MRHNRGVARQLRQGRYNETNTITIITTIIVSTLLGVLTPNVSPGVNFYPQNLFSQISSNLTEIKLSEVNPMESLGKVTLPFDKVWEALSSKLNLDVGTYSGPSKSSLTGRFGLEDTSGIGQTLGVAKSAIILVANILVAVLEIVLWAIKGIIGLIH